MKRSYVLVLLLVLAVGGGCATTPEKPSSTPIAEAGVGVTIWKIPVAGIGLWGLGGMLGYGSQVVVHQYNYQVQPAPSPPGTPPSPPAQSSQPQPSATPPPAPPVPYPTIYQSAWDDPTLVVFTNQSARTIRITIDDQQEIKLAGYQATADLHLGVGEHRVRLVVEKPTAAFGTLEVVRFPPPILIRPEGRSQIIYIYDY